MYLCTHEAESLARERNSFSPDDLCLLLSPRNWDSLQGLEDQDFRSNIDLNRGEVTILELVV